MATWDDIARNLNRLEELDEATLEEFARVMPPLSYNPNFNRQFDQTQLRIRRRLERYDSKRSSQKISNKDSDEKWYKKPVGIVALAVGGGLLLALIKYVLGI